MRYASTAHANVKEDEIGICSTTLRNPVFEESPTAFNRWCSDTSCGWPGFWRFIKERWTAKRLAPAASESSLVRLPSAQKPQSSLSANSFERLSSKHHNPTLPPATIPSKRSCDTAQHEEANSTPVLPYTAARQDFCSKISEREDLFTCHTSGCLLTSLFTDRQRVKDRIDKLSMQRTVVGEYLEQQELGWLSNKKMLDGDTPKMECLLVQQNANRTDVNRAPDFCPNAHINGNKNVDFSSATDTVNLDSNKTMLAFKRSSTLERVMEIMFEEIWPFLTLCDIARLSSASVRCFQLCEADHLWREIYNRDVAECLYPLSASVVPFEDEIHTVYVGAVHSPQVAEVSGSFLERTSRPLSAALNLLSRWFTMRRASTTSSAAVESHGTNPFGSFSTSGRQSGIASPLLGANDVVTSCSGCTETSLLQQPEPSRLCSTPHSPTLPAQTDFAVPSSNIIQQSFPTFQLPCISPYKIKLLEELALIETEKNKVLDDRIRLLQDINAFRQELTDLISRNENNRNLPDLCAMLTSRPDRSAELETILTQFKPKINRNLERLQYALLASKLRSPQP